MSAKPVSIDGAKTWTYKLRQGVKFDDGTEVTSADVKYTMEEVLAKFHPRTRLAFANVDGVDAPDPLTVVVRFKKRYAPMTPSSDHSDSFSGGPMKSV